MTTTKLMKYSHPTKGLRKGLSTKRWIKFMDTIINKGLKIFLEHIKGINNSLADTLSRLLA